MKNLTKEEQQEKTRKKIERMIRKEKLNGLLDDKDVEKILKDLLIEKGWLCEPI